MKAVTDRNAVKRDWLLKDNELLRSRTEANEALRMANEVIESEAFKYKEQTVREWNETIDARLWMSEVQKASNAQQEAKSVLDELAGTYSELLGGQRFAEHEEAR